MDSAGNLYVADYHLSCIREILAGTGTIVTVAGQCGHPSTSSLQIGDGGPATGPVLSSPGAVAVDAAGNLYIADGPVRKVSNGIITTVALAGGVSRVDIDGAGNLYLTDHGIGKVYKIANSVVTTIAGGCNACPPVRNGAPATSTNIPFPGGLRVDSSGRIYVADVFGVQVLAPLPSAPVSTILTGGVLNAASFAPVLAPGSLATVFGSLVLNTPEQASATPLPTALSGLSIQFQQGAGINSPLLYASSTQANIQVPWELAGHSSVPIRAVLNGNAGPSQTLQIASFAPGIFVAGGTGLAQGAIVGSTSRLVDAANPATAGDSIQIYCTGLGAVTNPPTSGSPSSNTTLSATTTKPEVTIGGIPAAVLFSGLAPGTVGEYQVNVQVPTGINPGPVVPVILSIGVVTSNTVTIGVR